VPGWCEYKAGKHYVLHLQRLIVICSAKSSEANTLECPRNCGSLSLTPVPCHASWFMRFQSVSPSSSLCL